MLRAGSHGRLANRIMEVDSAIDRSTSSPPMKTCVVDI
jgi:hypothetical protein